ncbi:GRB10-interacting GYF protein 2-like isoform X2 [Mya arenaria]|uniref:GRB10-interacting GYF protein 2-like isoform X2 n=1 Tax=Mya arenaria TaxID=6604 RepID=UPI0022E476F2|nr:GRB10-interacting GYF protein 2-like isoform X2 [Mya arenaria]
MADTLKFGPEWLRQLSGGNNVGTPPPSPAPGFGKYKLADYRYGREEMLALFTPTEGVPEELQQFHAILADKSQEPMAFMPPTEEEQRILSQSVNSQAVLRAMGRVPAIRGRGSGMERGRGRGRGRGDGFMQRGVSYDDTEGGGFGRPRQRPDGSWEEGEPKYPRPYQNRYSDPTQPNKVYQRSLSSDNWRDREEDDEEGGDWRRAGSKWNNQRGSWRDNRGFDPGYERGTGRGYSGQYTRQRSGGNWDEEELPEWSMDGEADELGTFDASGAFVSPKRFNRREFDERDSSMSPRSEGENDKDKSKEVNARGAANGGKDINDNRQKKLLPEKLDPKGDRSRSPSENPPPKASAQPSDNKSCDTNNKKQSHPNSASPHPSPKPQAKTEKGHAPGVKDKTSDKKQAIQSSGISNESSTNSKNKKNEEKGSGTGKQTMAKKNDKAVSKGDNKSNDVSARSASGAQISTDKGKGGRAENNEKGHTKDNKRREKLKSEAEALDQLQETVENMVAGITILEDEEVVQELSAPDGATASSKSGTCALPPEHEHYNKWFYRDPQGDLQGPFNSTEMAEWFSAGYFTMNLQVRRGCDEVFSPLGELIKHWGRVPFLPGQWPAPLLAAASPEPATQPQAPATATPPQQANWAENIAAPQDHQQLLQQYMQQQIQQQQQQQQQQMLMRQIQLQQQVQQIVSQLQENGQFKALPPIQQQQMALQILAKQGALATPPPSQPQKLSPRSSEAPMAVSSASPISQVSYNRSVSTPNTSQASPLPASIWDIDPSTIASMPAGGISAADLEAQLKEKEIEGERKRAEKQKEELRKEQEELRRQMEEIEKQRQEIERRKIEERTKLEEERLRAEEEKRKYEEAQRAMQIEEQRIRQMEEEKRKFEKDQIARQLEEQRIRQEEQLQQRMMEEEEGRRIEAEQTQREEMERQREMNRQQEIQKAQESQRQRESDEALRQQQASVIRQQQEEALRKQQQDALRKLQKEQLANMQLPSHAQWASQSGGSQSGGGKSLLEIQQQEEQERMEREELQRKQMEVQRQQMMTLQQQQQQQKSWTATVSPKASNKSLLEIQEEQARQLERERQKRDENQQIAAKNMSLGAASVWGSSPASGNWANEGAWGAALKQAQGNSGPGLGFWDDAIITSGPVKKQSAKQSKQQTGEFPALGGKKPDKARNSAPNKPKPSKSKKEEEAVQRLFQTQPSEDDFTQWCKYQLNSMATSVDIPTFIAFLQEVESPYEVHDYIRSYLGENKASEEFGKAFLEKRSQYRNKTRPAQPVDSIWGPAPAVTPRELRQAPPCNDDAQKSKASKKKKNKMMKVDASILGFTVHAAPDRIVGEIETVEASTTR